MTKICSCCKTEKPFSGFSRDSSRTSGIDSFCKVCRVENNRRRNEKNPERARAIKNKSKYGVTPEDLERVLRNQGGVCAICSGILTHPHIDHCHISGKFRGILCVTCNTGLGKFGDSVERIQKAIRYLQRF